MKYERIEIKNCATTLEKCKLGFEKNNYSCPIFIGNPKKKIDNFLPRLSTELVTQATVDSFAVGTEVASVEVDAPEPGEDVPREARHEQQVHADISTEKPETDSYIKPGGKHKVNNSIIIYFMV